jgi:hypothetical protein
VHNLLLEGMQTGLDHLVTLSLVDGDDARAPGPETTGFDPTALPFGLQVFSQEMSADIYDIDLDADSDNDGTLDRSAAEDRLEQDDGGFVAVALNESPDDLGNATIDDNRFERFVIELLEPLQLNPSVLARIRYSQHQGTGSNGAGRLRLWRAWQGAVRSPTSVLEGGDLVPTDSLVPLELLGISTSNRLMHLYVEGTLPGSAGSVILEILSDTNLLLTDRVSVEVHSPANSVSMRSATAQDFSTAPREINGDRVTYLTSGSVASFLRSDTSGQRLTDVVVQLPEHPDMPFRRGIDYGFAVFENTVECYLYRPGAYIFKCIYGSDEVTYSGVNVDTGQGPAEPKTTTWRRRRRPRDDDERDLVLISEGPEDPTSPGFGYLPAARAFFDDHGYQDMTDVNGAILSIQAAVVADDDPINVIIVDHGRPNAMGFGAGTLPIEEAQGRYMAFADFNCEADVDAYVATLSQLPAGRLETVEFVACNVAESTDGKALMLELAERSGVTHIAYDGFVYFSEGTWLTSPEFWVERN